MYKFIDSLTHCTIKVLQFSVIIIVMSSKLLDNSLTTSVTDEGYNRKGPTGLHQGIYKKGCSDYHLLNLAHILYKKFQKGGDRTMELLVWIDHSGVF